MRIAGGFVLAALVVLLLRSTALSSLAARGMVLDVLAFGTVVWALRYGAGPGTTFGFLIGLAADLDAAHWIGRHALALSLLGYGIGRLSRTLVRESARTQFVLFAVVTALHQAWTTVFEMGVGLAGLPYGLGRIGLATLATACAGTLFLMLVRRVLGAPIFGNASRSSASA